MKKTSVRYPKTDYHSRKSTLGIINTSTWVAPMENASTTRAIQGKWAGRFICAAIIHFLIATIATLLIHDPHQYFTRTGYYFSPARVIAGNGAGTWFFTGYISYLVVGVVATAVTAIFYFYIEGIQGKVYKGFTNLLAWGHLLFMNIGVAGAMIIMMYQGYLAGVAQAGALPGVTAGQIHPLILGWTVEPIGILLLHACVGAILGGLGYLIRSRAN